MAYHKDSLILLTQGVGGKGRLWSYQDTGDAVAAFVGAGFITNAGAMGAKVNDQIFFTDMTNNLSDRGKFTVVQDTGASQGTVVMDTG
jgi:hypothetical protein